MEKGDWYTWKRYLPDEYGIPETIEKIKKELNLKTYEYSELASSLSKKELLKKLSNYPKLNHNKDFQSYIECMEK